LFQTQKVNELNEKISITLSQMEALGNEGKVLESVELSRTVSELQRRKQDLEVTFTAKQNFMKVSRTNYARDNQHSSVCVFVILVVRS
jgi:hypothetical protein